MTTIPESVQKRFWSKVSKTDSCWIWMACRDKHGYGRFRLDGQTISAPRVAWIITHGPIPYGTGVLHNCPSGDNPSCVNPAHLWLGSQLDNLADMNQKGRHVAPNGAEHSLVMARVAAHGERHGTKTRPEAFPRGEAMLAAKLTDAQVLEIRAAYSKGNVSHRQLAVRFGVSHPTIGSILRNKAWRHLP